MSEIKQGKVTFRQKKQTACPICRTSFYKEEILTGRGRLIAGDLTEELRRLYNESKRYGRIYPLIYPVIVCPHCLFASFSADFNIPTQKTAGRIHENMNYRLNKIHDIFPNIDFNEDRTLSHGIASYILALISYSFFEKKYAPSLKRAICSMRLAWCVDDISKMDSEEMQKIISSSVISWDKDTIVSFRNLFYKKAAFFYKRAVEASQTGAELADGVRHYGPDVDKNFGYYGMLYMASLMNFRLGSTQRDPEVQIEIMENSKRIISKLFGSGKADREKPSDILYYAKELFSEIGSKLKVLEEAKTELE